MAPDVPVGRGHLGMLSAVILLPWSKFGVIPLGVMILSTGFGLRPQGNS